MTTSRLWLESVLLLLLEYEKCIILQSNVILKGTFYSVHPSVLYMQEEITLRIYYEPNLYNVVRDSHHALHFERHRKPTQRKAYESFKDCIMTGSVLIHDKEGSHWKLVEELSFKCKATSQFS